jgi:hypothetical protein
MHMPGRRTRAEQGCCRSRDHANRRTLLSAGLGLAGGLASGWLTPLAEILAQDHESADRGHQARSVIVLWMEGGPSQLETFDPHPGRLIAAGSRAIKTSVPGVQVSAQLPRMAERMDKLALVRSMVSKEGDHERATSYIKNGFRPQPTVVYPSLGSVICHQLRDEVEIPRHISILPSNWPARSGFLGAQYDAFQIGDPQHPVPDVHAQVPPARAARRLSDLADVVEEEFARGRFRQLDQKKTLHLASIRQAKRMMSSSQLEAFDIGRVPRVERQKFGETPFGRGCLAAARLVEVGVRCVEVTLRGWDTHINNHEKHGELNAVLDMAMSALVDRLDEKNLLQHTVVLWGGEFGRTPEVNSLDGRDHWPHGFTIALAGGGIRGGQVVGETSPDPDLTARDLTVNVDSPQTIDSIHATVLHALGVNPGVVVYTPEGRPITLNKAMPIKQLLAGR